MQSHKRRAVRELINVAAARPQVRRARPYLQRAVFVRNVHERDVEHEAVARERESLLREQQLGIRMCALVLAARKRSVGGEIDAGGIWSQNGLDDIQHPLVL